MKRSNHSIDIQTHIYVIKLSISKCLILVILNDIMKIIHEEHYHIKVFEENKYQFVFSLIQIKFFVLPMSLDVF